MRLPSMNSRNRLKKILIDRCLKVGSVQLSTGRSSHYYLDVKQATLHPEGSYLSALMILEELQRQGIRADAIGGLSLGADPIVGAVTALSFNPHNRFLPIQGFIIRQKRKSHGTEKLLEGFQNGPQGSPVVVVDDVCTSGGSILKAIRHAESKGYRVVSVLSIVDREEGAEKALNSYYYSPLFKASELLAESTSRR